MSKITVLESLNVLRLKAVRLDAQGRTVVLGGDNGQGKTSVLESLAMALGGAEATPPKPVHNGADKGKILVETDDGLKITLNLSAANGRGTLTVETKEKARYSSPQEVLKKLVGRIAFDPLEFCNMDARKQAEAVRKFVGLDFTALDLKRKALYDERASINKHVVTSKVKAEASPYFPDAPKEAVDTTKLMAELDAARKHNEKRAIIEKSVAECAKAVDLQKSITAKIHRDIADLEQRLANLRADLIPQGNREAAAAAEYEAAKIFEVEFKPIDEAPIRAQLADSARLNQQFQANIVRGDAFQALENHQEKADALTVSIDAIDADKTKQLAEAKWPVPGLGFDGDAVTINGVPLQQGNFDERLRVSLAMGLATKPLLRVVIIRDASLLDKKNFATLLRLLEEYDLQGFIERVGDGEECSVVIEDGEVAEVRDPAMKAAGEAAAAKAEFVE